jgi:hypothetical protein
MRTLLIAILQVLAARSQEDLDTRVQEMVAKLGDDSIETREDAVASLVALGEPVVGSLKQAILRSGDGEVRARIRGALDRIEADARRRKFKGGKPVCGLAASLEADLDRMPKEINLRVQIMNVGDQPMPLVLIQRWNTRFPDRSSSSSSSEAAVEIEQISGERSETIGCGFG